MNQPDRLLNRNFRLLWQGQFVSYLGTQFALVAIVLWIKHATDSATLVGLVQMLATLPAILLGPVGGAVADRYPRRGIIVLSDALRGALCLALAGVMLAAPGAASTLLVALAAVMVLNATVSAFFGPAISAAIPDLVPKAQIARANSLIQFSLQLTTFVGQGLGGILYSLLGAPLLFIINGCTFWFASGSESLARIPHVAREQAVSWRAALQAFRSDIREGLAHIWGRVGLRDLLLLSALLTFFTMPIIILLPFFVEDFLRVGPEWYGFILAAEGVGALIGYALAGSLRLTPRSRASWMVAFIILQSSGTGLLGLARSPFVALALALAGGITGGFVTVNITTIVQLVTPSEVRGRVFGLLNTLSSGLAPVAMGLAGVVADLVDRNIPLIYIVCGAVMGALSLLISLNPRFRAFLATEAVEVIPGPEAQPAV